MRRSSPRRDKGAPRRLGIIGWTWAAAVPQNELTDARSVALNVRTVKVRVFRTNKIENNTFLTSLGRRQRTARRVASHPVVIVCAQSWSLSVIDWERSSVDCWPHLTTIAVPSRNYSQFRGWRKTQEGITLMFGDIRISYLFRKYSRASLQMYELQKLWIQCRHDTGFYALVRRPTYAMTVWTYRHEVSK